MYVMWPASYSMDASADVFRGDQPKRDPAAWSSASVVSGASGRRCRLRSATPVTVTRPAACSAAKARPAISPSKVREGCTLPASSRQASSSSRSWKRTDRSTPSASPCTSK